MATAATAYGEEVVMIGKQIQGQTTVYKDGERLDSAIIVDGKSYAPTRSIGEAAGYEVSFDEGEIFLASPEPAVEGETEQTGGVAVETVGELSLEQVNSKIQRVTLDIVAYKSAIESKKVHLANNTDYAGRELHVSELQRYEDELVKAETDLEVLEAKKAALEAQQ